ncbi:hypothetical protein QJQ45_010582 [Haematococcus lacustris]|nr:hypothetical protein QJQ45_010582 [Haematococcus lacustris]
MHMARQTDVTTPLNPCSEVYKAAALLDRYVPVAVGSKTRGTSRVSRVSRVSSPTTSGPPIRKWLELDTNWWLNFQRMGESMQRPQELCSWKDREALPPVGTEYQQGYKRVNDRLPKGKGIADQREFEFEFESPATEIGVGIDPGATQAVSAASGVWDQASGQESGQVVADQLDRWKLTKGQVKHANGLNNSPRDTQRWLTPIKPYLQHLAAASSADTSLVANLKHITVTLATLDGVWEVYLDPKWARQRLRLYGAHDRALEQFYKQLEEDMAEVSMERHRRAKQLVVFCGAAIALALGEACCKVVCRPRGSDQWRGRMVLVDEHRTTRVNSAVNGKQPCEEELVHEQPTRRADWKPPAGQPPQALCSSQEATPAAASEPGPSTPPPAKRSKRTEAEHAAEPTQPTTAEQAAELSEGKAAEAKPAPQPGRWLDRDYNAARNMQRIGESKWRPLELCWWPDQGALPAKGKE